MTFILSREDVNTDVHPFLWYEILESLGIDLPDDIDDYPDQVEIIAKWTSGRDWIG